jgi:hypothetical protein
VTQAAAPAAENRSEGRANVFLTATLHAAGRPAAVRIRNISARGALIDGASLPPVGARVKLVRGTLFTLGHLAWAGTGQAGVNFDREIDVASWVQRAGHSGQQRVDRVVAALRRGALPPEVEDAGDGESLPEISAALDQLCERLAKAPEAAAQFGEELLKLDTIAQSLRRLATGKPY